jgi:predicted DNA-binding transcriptional regulator YafY
VYAVQDLGAYRRRRLAQDILDVPSMRKINRRLWKLERIGLVEVLPRGTAFVWRKRAGASGMAARAGSVMTFDEALALQTLRRFSSLQIRGLAADALAPMFSVADALLQRTNDDRERRYSRWINKVAVESGGFALNYPGIDRNLFAIVSRALFFEERKLDIVYGPRHSVGNERVRTILPLGLGEVGGLVYLVGGTEGKSNPTMYRMVEAEIPLKLKFWQGAGDHLPEAPMARIRKSLGVTAYCSYKAPFC